MEEFNNISFDLPKNQSNVIKVIGVGGGGSNAINHMFEQGIKGVDFVICNTDAQALDNSPVPVRIQLGVSLTEGLGAGANPKVGEQSALESKDEIERMLSSNTKMVFITAGMGGGTGTGAAPIIAKMAKDLGILTVGIVTSPFNFEGKIRNEQAQQGVEKLRKNVDSLIVINNNKLREVYGNLGFKAGFSKADEVLATAARGIAEVITHHYTQNIDLRDAKTVLADSGTAIMGSATASGANRAKEAISKALDSPLLNDNKIRGAKNVLLLIVSGTEEITIDEIGEINDYIQEEAGHSANIIMGVGDDENLEGSIAITIIATGFNAEQQNEIVNTESKKIIHTLDDDQKVEVNSIYHNPAARPGKVESPKAPEAEPKPEPVVRHTLFDIEEEIKKDPFAGYVPTTEFLKNLSVECEVVSPVTEDIQPEKKETAAPEFVIINKNPEPEVEKVREPRSLTFDFPMNTSNEPKKEMTSTHKKPAEIEVHDHVEIIPITETTDEGIKRYSLDDYQEMEDELINAKPAKDEYEEEVVFEKRTVSKVEKIEEIEEDEMDPTNSPISKLLRDRAEDRKRKMKEFNYKFRNSNSHIDEIEKEPAYKRMGVELSSPEKESFISRTSVNTDEDGIELRRNNSFLHDNVD